RHVERLDAHVRKFCRELGERGRDALPAMRRNDGPALLGVLLRELEADAGVRAGDQNGLGAREGPCEQRGEAQDSAERNARTAAAEQLAHEPILLCALAEEASIVDDTVTGRDGAARM